MQRKISLGLTALMCSTLLLSACGKEESAASGAKVINAPAAAAATTTATPAASSETAAPASPEDMGSKIVMEINDKGITALEVEQYAKRRYRNQPQQSALTDEQKQALVEELINMEVLAQQAVKNGIDQNADFRATIADFRRGMLAQAQVLAMREKIDVTDEMVKAEYDAYVDKNGSKEFKARHILVKDEDSAKAVIKELDGGADFAEMAKKHSTGPTGRNGGDLGWFAPGQMVAEFSDAAAMLEKGKYTSTPVQTQYGWHVILLEDSRSLTPPPFEQVGEQIRTNLVNKLVDEQINAIRAGAKTKIN